jgi:hypothetical protein
VASKASKKAKAGGHLNYIFGMHNKTDFASLMMIATDNAELVLTLPPAFTVKGLKLSPGKEIVLTPIIDSTTVGSLVWKLSNAGRFKKLKRLFFLFKFTLSVDPCATWGVETISASFFPYGRGVYNCHYDAATNVEVIQGGKKCHSGGDRKSGNKWGHV